MKIYNTHAGRAYANKVLRLEEELIGLSTSEDIVKPFDKNVLGLTNLADESIGQWEHPFYSEKVDKVFIDMRPYLTRTNELKDRFNASAFISRAQLEYAWVKEPEQFTAYMNELCSTFAVWMGNVLRTRFALSEIDIAKVKVVCVAHYVMAVLGRNGILATRTDELNSSVSRIATRVLRIPTNVVEQVFDNQVYAEFVSRRILDVNMFTAVLQNVCETPLDLTFDTLLQVSVPGAWAGKDDRQLTAIMFEHPPTLMWMIERYQTLGFFRKLGLGMAMESIRRQVDFDRVKRFVNGL